MRLPDRLLRAIIAYLAVVLGKLREGETIMTVKYVQTRAGADAGPLTKATKAGGVGPGPLREEPLVTGTAAPVGKGATSATGTRRYNLVLPEELFWELQTLADRQKTTVVELLRKFIKLGLLATKVEETPGSGLFIREGDRERQILLL